MEKFSTQYSDTGVTLLETYGIGDGSSTFNLPDYREVALVGIGSNGTDIIDNVNQNHDTYKLGEFKDDRFQGHDHEYYAPSDTEGNAIYEDMWCEDPEWQRTRKILSREDCGTARYGDTTRGKRKGVNYLIKVL